MVEAFEGTIEQFDELKSEFTSRSKKVIYKTVRAGTKKALQALVESQEPEGWTVSRQNVKSVRLQKEKNVGNQLEDDIWCILYRMGFDYLNRGHKFKIRTKGEDYRQVDVLAVDDESAVFVECTQSSVPRRKSMTNLIQYIVAIRQGASQSVRNFFDRKLKVGWVIATRNIEWTRADLDRARNERIIVIRDAQIEYFEKLAQQLKYAARYQLLAYLFASQKIAKLDFQVPATRSQMGGQTFYNFVMRPNDLLKIAYVAHKANQDNLDLTSYQRLISRNRLKKIANFIDNGGQFPTNIVINIHTRRPLKFDLKEKIGASAVGTLYLPSEYACAWVIDGQHRLLGYTHSKRAQMNEDKTTFPVLAYENLPSIDEAQMFVDINHEQKSVPTNLLKEIYATLHLGSNDLDRHFNALASKIVLELNSRQTSALHDRVQIQGSKSTDIRCLTITQISEPIIRKGFFGERRPGGQYSLGPLCDSRSDSWLRTYEKAYEALSGLFGFVHEEAPSHWNLGRRQGGFLCTNMGIRSLLGVYREILRYIAKRSGLELDLLGAEDFAPEANRLLMPLIKHFEGATIDEIRRFRDQVGMAGVDRNEMEMMSIIKKAFPSFTAEGLEEYIANQDVEGTQEAARLIQEINQRLYDYVVTEMMLTYGENENDWWVKIPAKIRKKASERREDDTDRKDLWNYLDLIDYRDIAHDNWNLFQNSFTLSKQDTSLSKVKRTAWITKINHFRQTTHHPEKGPLTREEVDYVREVHRLAMEKLQV